MRSLVARRPCVEVGAKFGRLVVLGCCFYCRFGKSSRRQYVVCKCECGRVCVVQVNLLKLEHTTSCGCAHVESLRQAKKHGCARRGDKLYHVWRNMHKRCYDSKSKDYAWYGGSGIKICEAWNDVAVFCSWAVSNGWRAGLILDRRENDKNYSPDNCHFVTRSCSDRNRRGTILVTAFGETKCLLDWSNDPRCTVKFNGLRHRLRNLKMNPEEAITRPAGRWVK